MKTHFILLASCSVMTACGDGFECSVESRNGVYAYSYEETGGTCGYIPGGTIEIRNGTNTAPVPSGCQVNYQNISEDECFIRSSVTCSDSSIGAYFTTVAEIEQMDKEGEHFNGSAGYAVNDLDTHALLCSGSYMITYTRISD